MRQDLHTHTNLCDGANSPEEMVLAAMEAGLDCLGLSGHSYTAYDESYCMSREGTQVYQHEIRRLREKYGDQIKLLMGIEQDLGGSLPTDEYDYVIGSVHALFPRPGRWFSVDESPEGLLRAAEEFYGGDIYALVEDYFFTVSTVSEVTRCDIIGHFDLVRKFNKGGAMFDERHPRYVAARDRAIKALCAGPCKLFEVNTGAISRGYQDLPYPAPEALPIIVKHGGKLILSSDSHRTDTLAYEFDKWERVIREMGLGDALVTLDL